MRRAPVITAITRMMFSHHLTKWWLPTPGCIRKMVRGMWGMGGTLILIDSTLHHDFIHSRPPPPSADDLDELLRDFSEIIGHGDDAPTAATECPESSRSPALKIELPVTNFFVQPPPPPTPSLHPSPPPPTPPLAASSIIPSTQYYRGLEPSPPSQSRNHLSPRQPQSQTLSSAAAFFPAAEPNSSGPFAAGQSASSGLSPHHQQNQVQAIQCSLCGWNFDNENFLQLHQGRLSTSLQTEWLHCVSINSCSFSVSVHRKGDSQDR